MNVKGCVYVGILYIYITACPFKMAVVFYTFIQYQNFNRLENIYFYIYQTYIYIRHIFIDFFYILDLDNISISGNKELLSQVWINLINNAIKFADKTISITLRKQDSNAVIEFKNDGTTITDEQVEHVFDQFYQADSSHAVMGHGLGLSIANKIVTLHNGTITCDNTQKGTTIFTIILPINS